MTDLLTATHNATYARLATLTLTIAGIAVPVFSNVPEGQKPPFIQVGLIDAEVIGEKGGGLERHAVEVEFQWRGSSKLPLFEMMAAARAVIETASPSAFPDALEVPRWQSSATDREEDGVTYHGVHRFELIAQAH